MDPKAAPLTSNANIPEGIEDDSSSEESSSNESDLTDVEETNFSLGPRHDTKLSEQLESEDPAVARPGASASSFSAFGIVVEYFSRPPPGKTSWQMQAFPERRVIGRTSAVHPSPEELEKWADDIGLRLGPAIPTSQDRVKVLQ